MTCTHVDRDYTQTKTRSMSFNIFSLIKFQTALIAIPERKQVMMFLLDVKIFLKQINNAITHKFLAKLKSIVVCPTVKDLRVLLFSVHS